jgi:hypothetical protein
MGLFMKKKKRKKKKQFPFLFPLSFIFKIFWLICEEEATT